MHSQMGGVRSNASKNGQISPSTTICVARGAGSRPQLASVLQEGRRSPNIHASSGAIQGIPVNRSGDGWPNMPKNKSSGMNEKRTLGTEDDDS